LSMKQQKAFQSFKKLSKVVNLESFRPFQSPSSALENINDLTEGVLNGFLQDFLDTFFPKKSAKLGVVDQNLASAIQDAMKISCVLSSSIMEIHRCIRLHLQTFLKGLDPEKYEQGFLDTSFRGLGHSYSRAKVKFNVNRDDNIIIQCISLLDQMDKDLNTLCMRIREWYAWHFPELGKIIKDNITYVKIAHLMGNRKEFDVEKNMSTLADLAKEQDLAQLVVQASKSSMGCDVSEFDMEAISKLTSRAVSFDDYKTQVSQYLIQKMNDVAPNLSALIGEIVAARLINHSGSLTNLAKCPASTIQILGAEKALFRALKSRKGNTPKYGIIFNSTFISRAKARDKGRISRYLANKCAIAARLDCFYDNATNIFGIALREQVEQRLVFYDTGKAPAKNIEVMQEVLKQASDLFPADEPSRDADLSKKRKRNGDDMDVDDEPKKKKSKKDKKDKKKEKRKSKK